ARHTVACPYSVEHPSRAWWRRGHRGASAKVEARREKSRARLEPSRRNGERHVVSVRPLGSRGASSAQRGAQRPAGSGLSLGSKTPRAFASSAPVETMLAARSGRELRDGDVDAATRLGDLASDAVQEEGERERSGAEDVTREGDDARQCARFGAHGARGFEGGEPRGERAVGAADG